jgi:hypothetical protein
LPSCQRRHVCVRGCLPRSCCCRCLQQLGQTAGTGIHSRSM